MSVWLVVGLIVLNSCQLFRPDYYEGTCWTCVDANGKEITRYVYPIPKPLPTSTAACDDRRRKKVIQEAKGDKEAVSSE
jgi:hypothetical protein